MKIYWYAPFNNALEIEIAQELAEAGEEIVFHSLYSRFGAPIPRAREAQTGKLRELRNLPEPAGEAPGSRASVLRRARVALRRSSLRAKVSREFDVYHVHTFNMFTDWYALPRLSRCGPVILTVHNVYPHRRRGPSSLERLTHRRGYRAASHLIVAHENLRNQLVEGFSIERSRISVIPLAIEQVDRNLRAQGSASDPPLFLMFGTLRQNKGTDVLLRAIDMVPESVACRFHFAGRGDIAIARAIGQAAARNPRITAEIEWISPERQRQLYRSAWAVVLPYTDFHAQSGVLREAYAYGLPTIASDVGALGSAVRGEGTGWVVQPGDAKGLAETIELVATAQSERAQIAERSRSLAASRSPRAISAHLQSLYGELVPHR